MVLEELIAVLGWDIEGEEKLRQFNAGLEQVAKRIATFATAAVVAGAGALAALGKSVISVSAQFESLEASLTTVTGSTDQAKSAMDWITNFAAATPYEINGITEAFIKLKSYGIDPLADDALRTLGDAASAMNKPLDQAVEALADATSFEFERLKEFGLRTQQKGNEVTFTWTKNGKELSKTIKKNSEDVRKFILEQLGDRFNGAMVRQSKTWNGMMSNLGDSWTSFLLRIGRGGFFEAVRGKLADLLDYFNRLAEDGTLDRWAKSISNVFEWGADAISRFVTRVGRDFATIGKLITENQELFKVLGAVLLGLAIYAMPVAAAFLAAGVVIDDFLTYLRGGESVIGDAVKWLGELKDTILEWLAALPGSIKDGITRAFRAGFEGAKAVVLEFCEWATAKLSAINPLNLFKGDAPTENQQASPFSRDGGSSSLGQPLIPYGSLLRDRTAHGDALMDNAAKNFGRMGSSAAAAINSTVNDNSNRSVQVNVTQNVQQATQAPRAAAQATANAIAGAAGARPAAWHEQGETF